MDCTVYALQTYRTCLHLASIHQTAPPLTSNSSRLIEAHYYGNGVWGGREGGNDNGGVEAPFMDPRYAPALTSMVLCLETKTVQDTDD